MSDALSSTPADRTDAPSSDSAESTIESALSTSVDSGLATPLDNSVDWDGLRAVALEAMQHAYVPYSNFPVGVAAIVDDGRVIAGCNVENASYGLTLCAECALVSSLHMTGGGRLVAFTCVDGRGNALMPCGRCRQLLFEHSAPGMLLETVSGIRTIDEVIPDAFGPRTLEEYRTP